MTTFDTLTGRPLATPQPAFVPQALVPPGATPPISRRLATSALVLALLTGLVAGQLAAVLRQPFEVTPVQGAGRAVLLASVYYDAVNSLLAGDGADLLESIVGTDYVGHAGVDETLERKRDLLGHLDDLHSFFPRAHLETEVVFSSPDVVMVRIELMGAAQGMLMGAELQWSDLSPRVETLRFSGDRLVERWGTPSSPVDIEQLGSASYEPTFAAPMHLRLEQITLAVNGRMSLSGNIDYLVRVESGTVALLGSDRPLRTATPGDVQQGELTIASRNGPYHLTNRGLVEATFLLLRLERYDTSQGALLTQGWVAASDENGVDRTILSTSVSLEADRQPWLVTLTRVTLQAGVAVGTHPVNGAEIIVLESGKLFIAGNACDSQCVETHEGVSASITADLQLDVTDGFAAVRGAEVSYESSGAGPTTFLMITIART